MVSIFSTTDLARLIQGYRFYAKTEGKSDETITIVANSVGYLENFLRSEGLPTNVTQIGSREIRAFILYLQQKRCFRGHPLNKTQERGLSGHTINCYLRSIRAFWSWLVSEEIIEANPLARLKIPKAPKKVIRTFSDVQLEQLLSVIDTCTAEGYRDQAIILTLLDTALRVSELVNIRLDDLWLEEGLIKVMGKGGKERFVPIGKSIQRILWRYINKYRAEPATPNCDFLFLTTHGRPMTKDRIDKKMSRYGEKAGIKGVRCSPHTLRHTAAVRFLRNGGDVFSLQRMLGHSTLEMTRHYCELADVDVKRAHATASPVDNLTLKHGWSKMRIVNEAARHRGSVMSSRPRNLDCPQSDYQGMPKIVKRARRAPGPQGTSTRKVSPSVV
jgi:site-specific recombinase XerD